jgi:hypothetical protein
MEVNCQPNTPAAMEKQPLVSTRYNARWALESVVEIYIKRKSVQMQIIKTYNY